MSKLRHREVEGCAQGRTACGGSQDGKHARLPSSGSAGKGRLCGQEQLEQGCGAEAWAWGDKRELSPPPRPPENLPGLAV